MREILFRGKRIDNGEWVEGDLIHTRGGYPLICVKHDFGSPVEGIEVDYATIGQYTGTIDTNGRRVFEGDIIGHISKDNGETSVFGVARWSSEGCFYINCDRTYYYNIDEPGNNIGKMMPSKKSLIVIGNIHDNPEMLKGDEKTITLMLTTIT